MDTCKNCGARMVPLFTSEACSAECDLEALVPKEREPEPLFVGYLDYGASTLSLQLERMGDGMWRVREDNVWCVKTEPGYGGGYRYELLEGPHVMSPVAGHHRFLGGAVFRVVAVQGATGLPG